MGRVRRGIGRSASTKRESPSISECLARKVTDRRRRRGVKKSVSYSYIFQKGAVSCETIWSSSANRRDERLPLRKKIKGRGIKRLTVEDSLGGRG